MWVGAWWIGFLVFSFVCLLVAVPLIAYPKTLPGSEKLQKISEAHNGDNQKSQAFTKLSEIPKAFMALCRNPTFLFLNLAGASEGLIISGFAVFLPKQIENQYSVTAVWAALLMGKQTTRLPAEANGSLTCNSPLIVSGIITVPAGGGGTFLGGYLVKKLKLCCSGTIKFCMIASIFATLFTICFFLSCPNLNFAGVTSSYQSADFTESKAIIGDGKYERYTLPATVHNLESQCNKQCGCSKDSYEPVRILKQIKAQSRLKLFLFRQVCGADGLLYFSPCFAGCRTERSIDGSKVYQNCVCIINNMVLNHSIINKHQHANSIFHNYDAVNTMCESKCSYLGMFVVLCFFVMFFTFLATMPALSATLRCVDDKMRSFALGVQWIVVRIFGTIPAPILFGRLIDESCILWQESCGLDSGACLLYDNKVMSKYMLFLALVGKSCSVLFFFLAWYFYIPPKVSDIKLSSEGNLTSNGEKYVKKEIVEKY